MDGMKPKPIIRLSKSSLGLAEKVAVMGVLDREFLGMGVEVQQFENDLSEFFGRNAVCVSTGTASLQLALQGCRIGMNDEVLVQSLTYVASFQAISSVGAIPVACEVNPNTLTLDLKDAEKRLTEKTKAIMPVHYAGGVGELDKLYSLAQKYKLRVIEDAAHAFGTIYQGRKIGSNGDIVCFSFDGIKNITSGEGGCLVTDDQVVLQSARDARLLGVEKDTEERYKGNRSWKFDVSNQGWRYHMSNIMAAIGIQQLKRFDEFACIRRERAKLYDALLKDHPKIVPLNHNYEEVVPHIYVVRLIGSFDRSKLQEELLKNAIQTGIHYQPNHFLSYYRHQNTAPLTITESIYSQLLTLPLHADISEDDVNYIANVLKTIL
uniref:DegT/DnrJ/EryC1/StrS family aminotransferase n=1 Tax=Polynucleobacter sp. TaxID=2029855 RepID=UPI0040473E4C